MRCGSCCEKLVSVKIFRPRKSVDVQWQVATGEFSKFVVRR